MFRNISKYLIVIFLTIFLFSFKKVSGQYYSWQMLRYELYGGGGVTNFMGDVGAPLSNDNFLKSNFWVNKQSLRWVGQTGLKMALGPHQKIRANLAVGMLYNDDRYGGHDDRYLNFRSIIVELSGQYELYFVPDKRISFNKYSQWINTPRKWRNLWQPMYLFVGVGGIYFNPKGYALGQWHSLQPLHTEGQETPYSRISAVVPAGLGIKIRIARYHSIFVEAGWRLALTDYIDDVSDGKLLSTDEMRDKYGELAAILFYRRHGEQNHPEEGYTGGEKRGGQWFDQYQFLTINYAITLKADWKNRPTLKMYRPNDE